MSDLELLAFYPRRRPAVQSQQFARRQLADAVRKARELFKTAGVARVQLSHILVDRRRVLLDWAASSLQVQRDDAGRRAKNHAW